MRFIATLFLLVSLAAQAADKPSTAAPNVTVLAEKLAIPGLNRERTIRLYLPPSYDKSPAKRYPVLYMHDAQNLFDAATSFAGEWGVDESLNELAAKEGLEIIVVGIDNGDEHRLPELTLYDSGPVPRAEGEAYLRFVAETVKPFIDSRYRTLADRAHTGMMGSSLGGLITHGALLRYPQLFGRVGIFSPSYWVNMRLYDEAGLQPLPSDTRVYLYVGGGEGGTEVDDTVRMSGNLVHRNPGAPIELRIAPTAQHNETAWRAEFPRAVKWLFQDAR
ncbi:MAG: alpha/beta hydrolase [Paucibacter sp.]|nr:alpha/beta hydrolase [Roseateles sp.]